ncbi:histidine kinase [Streptosporangium sp. NPDC051023]|uniref:sensor histidine kinase n=1 Tax=Streptosporangium sp. NPDC051023 TaxID=3155410 RepID=UPI00344C9C1A
MTRDTGRSLTRRSLLVAGVCAMTDAGLLLLYSPSAGGWRFWTMFFIIVAIDAALATPARFSGVVAALHGLALLLTPFLFVRVTWQVAETGLLVAGYRAGAWLRSAQALAALAALTTGIAGCHLLSDYDNSIGLATALPSLVLEAIARAFLPWLVGRYTTDRRAYIAELERQAELRRHDEQIAVQRAVAEERSAIARDLHDVISHHVSAIGMHAGAARLGLGVAAGNARPDDRVHRSLTAVESSSRSAMADLRRLLAILHGDETDTARRQPGLNNLDELLDGVRAAGLTITLTTHGVPRELPGSLDVTLYRIAQEALTNALRHGEGESVDIELEYRDTEAVVTVTNQLAERAGHPESRNSPHRGLAGIRQRVTLFGGRVTYGVRPDGRHWQVRVSFPLEQPCP